MCLALNRKSKKKIVDHIVCNMRVVVDAVPAVKSPVKGIEKSSSSSVRGRKEKKKKWMVGSDVLA